MKTHTFCIGAAAAFASLASANPIPQASPPDNTVYHQTPTFKLKAVNLGPNADIFPSDSLYLHSYHVEAAVDLGALLVDDANTPRFYLNATDLGRVSGGQQLQFGRATPADPDAVPSGASVQVDGANLEPVSLEPGAAQPSWDTYADADSGAQYVYYHQIAQGGRLYGCRGDTAGVADAGVVIVKYGGAHVDPTTPAACSELALEIEYC